MKLKLVSEHLPTSGKKANLIERLNQTKDLGPVIEPSTSFADNMRKTRQKNKAARNDDNADKSPDHGHKIKPLRIVLERIDMSKYQTKLSNGSDNGKAINAKTNDRIRDKDDELSVNQNKRQITQYRLSKALVRKLYVLLDGPNLLEPRVSFLFFYSFWYIEI